jgi:hypothetical protein
MLTAAWPLLAASVALSVHTHLNARHPLAGLCTPVAPESQHTPFSALSPSASSFLTPRSNAFRARTKEVSLPALTKRVMAEVIAVDAPSESRAL